VRRNHK